MGLTPMIPGLTNIPSVGSKPTCRGGKAILLSVESLNKSFDVKQVATVPKTSSKIADLVKGGSVKYDPIINPIPNYIQNPYILKQKQMALDGRTSAKNLHVSQHAFKL